MEEYIPKINNPLSFGESKREEEKQSSVTHSLHTLHDSEKKEPRSFRIKPSQYKAISRYARLSESTIGDVVVNACYLLMEIEPVNGNVFIVEKPHRNIHKNIQSDMQEFICIDDMQDFIEKLEKDDTNNQRLMKIRRKAFIELLKDCNKVKIWGEELSDLVIKARSYFE